MPHGRVLVYGLGVSGAAVAAHMAAEGVRVVAADDDAGPGPRSCAARLGVDLVVAPGPGELRELAHAVDEIVVSPGVPARHPVFGLGGAVPIVGEIEVAWRRARCPIVAVTGTNGKTTVTTLIESMLRNAGRNVVAAGNIGRPLIEAVDGDAEIIVAETSSFQLALTRTFRPAVGAWLNFSEDHLDWHPDVPAYRAAKARLWANCGPGDVAVANAGDTVVAAEAEGAARRGASVRTFGVRAGAYTQRGGELVGPEGPVVGVDELPRHMPHDLENALCALAAADAAGAPAEAGRAALVAFRGLPHRVELVGEANGVRFFDDSKATTPGAVLAALAAFDSSVLIAGGRNKGLDLAPLREAAPRLRGVVAIGEAADQVAGVLADVTTVTRADSMSVAVARAQEMARPGDAVVLSPACASFDWYASYAERGDDFARCVRALPGVVPAQGSRGRDAS